MEKSEDVPNFENDPDHIGFRDGNLFIVDVLPEMFNVDPNTQETYFVECLQTYGRILSQKLSWNRNDWMGLMLFGTKEWDTDPETKYILTVQKLGEVTTKMMKEIMEILNNKVNYYKEMSTDAEYPLHDVLWHATRTFDSVKVAMSRRQVILLTCKDDPFSNNETERHRIRLRAKTFSDVNINLRIIGLGQKWNHELFYKDVELLANKIENEDVRRMFLEDLEVQMRFDAKTASHTKLRIGNGLQIRTVISPFSCMSKYLKKVRMSKTTNEVLDVFRHYNTSESTFCDDSDEDSLESVPTQGLDSTCKAISCGDETLSLGHKEVAKLRMPLLPGIDLIGFKKASLDLRYHIGPTKFVGVDNDAEDEEKELFTALLYQCEAKDVMAICAVNGRNGPYLAKLLPCTRYGGFYLYKIAYYEQVNDLSEYIKMYNVDEEDDDDVHIDETGLALMEKVVKKLRMKWDPYMFRNPKLQAQLAYIETLALDTVVEPLDDTTSPAMDMIERKLGNITTEFQELFESVQSESTKRQSSTLGTKSNVDKSAKFDDVMIQGLIDTDQLKGCTIAVLKSMAKSLGIPTTGVKADLIKRITQSFVAKNLK